MTRLFADVASTSNDVAATRSRTAKTQRLAELLTACDNRELPLVVCWLAGETRQRRLGVGWASVFGDVDARAAPRATLSVVDVDTAFDVLASAEGPGSVTARREVLTELFDAMTETEAGFLRALLTGGLRQGAQTGVVVDALANAFQVPAESVRRAHLLVGDLGETASIARRGLEALASTTLVVGRAVQPMLASTSTSVEAAMAEIGMASVEWKLDGARIQVHKRANDVQIFTRNLNEITSRLPDVVRIVRALPFATGVLDGEVLGIGDDGHPRPFQSTISEFATESTTGRDPEAVSGRAGLAPFFFDILHLDGRDLLDEQLTVRDAELRRVVGSYRIPGVITDDVDAALAVQNEALHLGHEGVMVKAASSTYDAGRRGAAWRKVKPVRTFDLVVLAGEWGSGRRQGWLSNLHLGARDPNTGDMVMVGKTFKGLTDALLTWQTAAFLERETRRTSHTVFVRPELVVEIAIDGAQHSTRYPGGVALRFARVKRYRGDKSPADADTIDSLRALLP